MAGLLGIGLTGLNAAQAQLNTTSHNIANAATPGYNRQSVHQTTNDPLFSGAGFFGQGVRVSNITRQYSQFLENQVLSADNRRAEHSAYNAQISQINNMLADPDVGLAPAMQDFFAGVQEVAANPSNIPARQALLSSGQALATRFQTMDARLSEIRAGTEGEIGATVDTINSFASQIAELNQRIAVAQAGGAGQAPNDLLDQRNQVVSELNQLVRTSTAVAADGQMSVFIGSGQNLVLGTSVTRLGTATDPADPTRQSIVTIAPNGAETPLPEKLLTGGALGGLLAFRRESLDVAQNRMNLLARSVTETFNAQHRLGMDLEGAMGLDFFRPSIVQREGDGSGAFPLVEVADDSLLTNERYSLTVVGGGYTLNSLPGGATVDPDEIGLEITLPAGAVDGEVFTLTPLRNAARDFAVALQDPSLIAAANPIAVEIPVSNAGSGAVGDIKMLSTGGAPPLPPSFELTFDAATNSLLVDPPPASISSTDFDPATDAAGKQFTVTLDDGSEFSFTLSGTPQDEDIFNFLSNKGGVADNRNAVALGALQTTKTMLGSSATFQSGYAQLVSQIGNKAREAQVGEAAQDSLLRQAKDSRDSLSGVNLDEEAANLIRFQQAYQASGRVISIAQRLFDEIVSIGR